MSTQVSPFHNLFVGSENCVWLHRYLIPSFLLQELVISVFILVLSKGHCFYCQLSHISCLSCVCVCVCTRARVCPSHIISDCPLSQFTKPITIRIGHVYFALSYQGFWQPCCAAGRQACMNSKSVSSWIARLTFLSKRISGVHIKGPGDSSRYGYIPETDTFSISLQNCCQFALLESADYTYQP